MDGFTAPPVPPHPPALRENAQAVGCSHKTNSSRAKPGDTECLDRLH